MSVVENVLRRPERVPDELGKWFVENPGVWVAEVDGRVVGFSAGDPRDGSIFALFMDRAWERQGIGRQLFDHAVADLVKAGYRTLRLGTQPGSRAAEFYRAAGWKESGEMDHTDVIFTYEVRI